MKKELIKLYQLLILTVILVASCKKGWLDAKPSTSLATLSTVQDCQAILDNSNSLFNGSGPAISEIGADNYYFTYTVWNSRTTIVKNSYIWAQDIYQGTSVSDWNVPYKQVLNVNLVLDALNKIPTDSSNLYAWNNAYGIALFYRAFAFYNLAQVFCKPYFSSTAISDLGIPLRLTADVNDKSVRSSVQQTYDQIIQDLNDAGKLLPLGVLPGTTLNETRATKTSVFGLLARTYLAMGNYTKAFTYADSALQLYNILMDFNQLSQTSSSPISKFNSETIFYSSAINYSIGSSMIIDSVLYQSYNVNDLRRSIFFTISGGLVNYKGSYSGSTNVFFDGLATDEMYLIRAECFARAGNTTSAMNDLNTLLQKRWKTGTFVPLTASNQNDALNQIIIERRKELIFRTIRWTDLRRLNQESQFAVTITRNLNGQLFTLAPNDNRYVFPIPDQEIQISGIQQNPR